MVYYGALSQGCQQCRRRKIKCDQRKPGCLKCEKAQSSCPGYRDLSNEIFRDESARVIRKARSRRLNEDASPGSTLLQGTGKVRSSTSMSVASMEASLASTIPQMMGQSLSELATAFFFAKYTCDEPPFSKNFRQWLVDMYVDGPDNCAPRAAMEAAGMAGIANIYHAPHVGFKSKEAYCRALSTTKRTLDNPESSVSDATLMTAILLGMVEFLTLDSIESYEAWFTHIEGGLALLNLRGQPQFDYERGGQLLLQLRHQILFACVQQDLPPPKAFLAVTEAFNASPMGQRRRSRLPTPIGDMCFHILALRAAIKDGTITGSTAICNEAKRIDRDLQTWRSSLPRDWEYHVVQGAAGATWCFRGEYHVYENAWVAQVWNNWRAMRILLQQLIISYSDAGALNLETSDAVDLVRKLSSEICHTTCTFVVGKARSSALIWPLSVVAQEPRNGLLERRWAVKHLQDVGAALGMRRATVIADAVARELRSDAAEVL
ncbi:hypothetical protein EJ04DRAFT_581818 [Polyplosphaeria fusca]|uniref:Zn(2)-C6 fungal-type domain-containing protein n=1 Tax=Polyplosphaeria fusca TaxID=682080 RepID=A0A9P4UX05_9PLEO|nr:hypothetical protein EJ04DRAFT_581818 [Polyplosphaeria fusca]